MIDPALIRIRPTTDADAALWHLALVPDVVSLRAELTVRERGSLRTQRALLDTGYAAWRGVAGTEDGVSALTFITAVD